MARRKATTLVLVSSWLGVVVGLVVAVRSDPG
jgi:hypothetical protein